MHILLHPSSALEIHILFQVNSPVAMHILLPTLMHMILSEEQHLVKLLFYLSSTSIRLMRLY